MGQRVSTPSIFCTDEATCGLPVRLGLEQYAGVRVVLVEDARRFARDLLAQELGIGQLTKLGMRVLAAKKRKG